MKPLKDKCYYTMFKTISKEKLDKLYEELLDKAKRKAERYKQKLIDKDVSTNDIH